VRATYHPGKIEVQEGAGVRPMVERLRSSIRPTIPPATREFSEERLAIVVGFVDADGRVWASLLAGEPGFVLALDERTVRIRRHAVPRRPVGIGSAGDRQHGWCDRHRMHHSDAFEWRGRGAPRRNLRAGLPLTSTNCKLIP
jgi:hypothetical protein